MERKKVILIEDEVKLARFVELELRYEGYDVTVCHDGREGLQMVTDGNYDMILLDLMLPGLTGIEICRRVRKFSNVPIIMLTAKDETMDKVAGLDSGADDYLTKPFAIEELLARMRVAFKHAHAGGAKKVILEVQGLEIDTDKRMVTVNGTVVDLTKKEYELLLYLVQNKNIVLSREQIWQGDYDLEKTAAALSKTQNITAYDGDKLVGCLRILSDGYFFGTITELLVLPDYQKQGIGSKLLQLARENAPSLLYFGAQPGLESFYEKNGCQKSLQSYIIKKPEIL